MIGWYHGRVMKKVKAHCKVVFCFGEREEDDFGREGRKFVWGRMQGKGEEKAKRAIMMGTVLWNMAVLMVLSFCCLGSWTWKGLVRRFLPAMKEDFQNTLSE